MTDATEAAAAPAASRTLPRPASTFLKHSLSMANALHAASRRVRERSDKQHKAEDAAARFRAEALGITLDELHERDRAEREREEVRQREMMARSTMQLMQKELGVSEDVLQRMLASNAAAAAAAAAATAAADSAMPERRSSAATSVSSPSHMRQASRSAMSRGAASYDAARGSVKSPGDDSDDAESVDSVSSQHMEKLELRVDDAASAAPHTVPPARRVDGVGGGGGAHLPRLNSRFARMTASSHARVRATLDVEESHDSALGGAQDASRPAGGSGALVPTRPPGHASPPLALRAVTAASSTHARGHDVTFAPSPHGSPTNAATREGGGLLAPRPGMRNRILTTSPVQVPDTVCRPPPASTAEGGGSLLHGDDFTAPAPSSTTQERGGDVVAAGVAAMRGYKRATTSFRLAHPHFAAGLTDFMRGSQRAAPGGGTRQVVIDWLAALELSQYTPMLLAEGYDSISRVIMLDVGALKELPQPLPRAHARHLLLAAAALKSALTQRVAADDELAATDRNVCAPTLRARSVMMQDDTRAASSLPAAAQNAMVEPDRFGLHRKLEAVCSLTAEQMSDFCSAPHITGVLGILASTLCILFGEKASWSAATALLANLDDFKARARAVVPKSMGVRTLKVMNQLLIDGRIRDILPPEPALYPADTHPAINALLEWVVAVVEDGLAGVPALPAMCLPSGSLLA